MAKLTNISGLDLHVYAPDGEAGSVRVTAGQVLDVPGDVTEIEDAWIANGRAFPKNTWDIAKPKKASGKADAEPGN